MRAQPAFCLAVAAGVSMVLAGPASASFYLMQIEQAIGGVDGDTSAQAIQLRMRFPGDSTLEFARIRAWDAAGDNPITLIDFDAGVPNNNLGDRILAASPGFADYTETALPSDFTLTNLIPESYLAAGRITYEGDDGIIYWLLSFGGAGYTGPTTGSNANDADGDFGPPLIGPLPSSDLQSLLFQGTAMDPSTTNLADYALSAGPAVFTNNAGLNAAVVPEPGTLSLFAFSLWTLARRRTRQSRA
ncbi:MAG: PEP-CTERM sorting domain-containing protein [Phycisphaerales bacterium]|nr:MAG: PEP-CTERM sorting domain-containing protein [Phycisphaerales bacterium]